MKLPRLYKIHGVGFHYSSDAPGRVGISYIRRDGGLTARYEDRNPRESPMTQAIRMLESCPGVTVLEGITVAGSVTMNDSRVFFVLDDESYNNLMNAAEKKSHEEHERKMEAWGGLSEEARDSMELYRAHVLYDQPMPSQMYMNGKRVGVPL